MLAATINAIAAAPFLVIVMLISRDRRLMGEYANGRLSNVLGWITVVVMVALGVTGLIATFTGS